MWKFLLALTLITVGSIGIAHAAACPSSLELQDANGVKAPGKYTDDGSGNCQVNTATQDGANSTLGAKADTAWSTGSGSAIAILKATASGVLGNVPLGTTGGWTPVVKTGIIVTPTIAIKASSGQLGFVQCDNNNAAWSYLQIFDLAAGSVAVGSTVAVQVVPIAPSLSNGFVANLEGMQFANAISVAATTTPGGAVAVSSGLNCSFGYH